MPEIKEEIATWKVVVGVLVGLATIVSIWVDINREIEHIKTQMNHQKEQYQYERQRMYEDVRELKDDIKEIKKLLLEEQKQGRK